MQYQTTPLCSVWLGGELRRRALMTLERFAQADFAPDSEKTFRHAGYEWPGDNEGRLLLAHILLARCTHQTSRYFRPIWEQLQTHLNEKGYMGPVLADGFVSEQQIAGNSWLLRSLLEHYDWTGDARTRQMIDSLVDNYLLPLADVIHTYPSSEEVSNFKGEAEGSLIRSAYGKWYMSTDFGCLFIMLDGATQSYALRRDELLRRLIEAMIEQFCAIDVQKLSFQTHATLSCTRAILRYYTLTGEARYLEIAQKYYALYLAEGMTAAYSNYNWFNLPEFTEPCAVIDSFLLAMTLWNITGDEAYLNDACLIQYNGVYAGQRGNGGFGCDVCAGVASDCIVPSDENFEAWWCCSKRGAEFFSTAAAYLCVARGNTVLFPVYESMTAEVSTEVGTLLLREAANFSTMGSVCVEVLRAQTTGPVQFGFFVPEWVTQGQLSLLKNGEPMPVCVQNGFAYLTCTPSAGDVFELRFAFVPRLCAAAGRHTLPTRSVLFHGPCLLGARLPQQAQTMPLPQPETLRGEGCGVYTAADGTVLRPLCENTWLTKETLLRTKLQLTFAAQGGAQASARLEVTK